MLTVNRSIISINSVFFLTQCFWPQSICAPLCSERVWIIVCSLIIVCHKSFCLNTKYQSWHVQLDKSTKTTAVQVLWNGFQLLYISFCRRSKCCTCCRSVYRTICCPKSLLFSIDQLVVWGIRWQKLVDQKFPKAQDDVLNRLLFVHNPEMFSLLS